MTTEAESAVPSTAREGRRYNWVRRLAPHRFVLSAITDGLLWGLALGFSTWLRYDLSFAPVSAVGLLSLIVFAAFLQILIGRTQGLYQGRWRFGSFEELTAMVGTVATTTGCLILVNVIGERRAPMGAVVLAGPLALVLMAGARYTWRLSLEHINGPKHEQRRAVVYGAGDAAHQLVRSMLGSPSSPMVPVGAIDDDLRKRSHRLARGVPVLGDGTQLVSIIEQTGADVVVVAMPSATSDRVRAIVETAEEAGAQVLIVPHLWELADHRVEVADVRAVTIADLLGRHQLDLDISAIAEYVTGRRVLVTGAGGSIGSELCRQLARFGPAELVMLDRDESSLHGLQLSLDDEGRVDDDHLVVADIRDRHRLTEVFEQFLPEVVFHAAALKHVPLLELHPDEAVKTNVEGTANVLDASRATGVARFINVSTDKAADPVNVLGQTKLLAEGLTAEMASLTAGTYVSVRFGNVLGSRGSMLTTFEHQVRVGGPLTVTHPEVTRYFMTIEEAVQLVIQAGAMGSDGEVLVLEMGDPVRIDDVARRMAESVNPPIEIRYTGLRPGEKLYEVLFADTEVPEPTEHPLVRRVAGRPWSIADLRIRLADRDPVSLALKTCVVDLRNARSTVP